MKKVLIVDDDESLAAMLREYLGAHGIEAEVARTPTDALQRIRASPLDAIVLDVMLPEMDGFELLPKLRALVETPILMLTARGDETDRIVGLELGADDYLPKPFNPRELLARLRAAMRRGASPGASGGARFGTLRLGVLEIDIDARRVRLGGEERELTSYQFDLLLALARNAGKVMTRAALVRETRGAELPAFDRSIDVHISRIRSAIEEDPKSPRRVVTIRGVGYVFTRDES